MSNNPYVTQLVSMGYDEDDCRILMAGQPRCYPYYLHGRTFTSEEDYVEALSEFLNGL